VPRIASVEVCPHREKIFQIYLHILKKYLRYLRNIEINYIASFEPLFIITINSTKYLVLVFGSSSDTVNIFLIFKVVFKSIFHFC